MENDKKYEINEHVKKEVTKEELISKLHVFDKE